MTGLPTGWALAPINTFARSRSGNSKLIKGQQAQEPAAGLFPAFSASGQDVWVAHPEHEGNAIIISAVGARCGKTFRATGQWSAVANTHIVWPEEIAVDTDWLQLLLNDENFWEKGGSAQPFVKVNATFEREIPLPPLPEQRRIVRKLDTLSARSSTARTHLTAIEKLVERYKSGVLGLELSGVPLGNEADEQNTQPITNDNERGAWTFEALPTHWVWTGFKAFLENQTDSYRKLPQKDYQSEGEYPVIDQGADLIGGYSNDATLLLPAQPPYIIFGDHTRCVKFFEAPFVQGADGVKVFHAGKDVDIRFAYWALKGLQLPDKGYSRHAKFLKESYFPRPPIDEQREIVRRIEAAFGKIDRLAAEAAKALKLLGHLDQRILAKAFAGDLVPQDPTDEPAETLLARIRESRAAAPKSRRGRK